MPSFTPPTIQQSMDDPFWGRYSIPVGQSVVKKGDNYELTPFPWAGDLDGLTEGVDYFLGGRTYVITDAVATALTNDGFTTTSDLGYGQAPYGTQGYGY